MDFGRKSRIWSSRRLCLLLTRTLCVRDPIETLRQALRAGVDLVQVREKPFGEDAVAWCQTVVEESASVGVPVVINDRIDLVQSSGAAAVHLGQEDLDATDVARLESRDFALGISTHDDAERDRARGFAPDYVGVGPCFPTRTKGLSTRAPRDWLERCFRDTSLPCLAIGGLTPERVPELVALGARGLAVSSAILAAPDPGAVVRRFLEALDARPAC